METLDFILIIYQLPVEIPYHSYLANLILSDDQVNFILSQYAESYMKFLKLMDWYLSILRPKPLLLSREIKETINVWLAVITFTSFWWSWIKSIF
jgi:dsDNA-binding SOS-regulon protein